MELIELCLPEAAREGIGQRARAWCESIGKTVVEVPYTFRDRELGASKFGRREVVQYLQQVGMVTRDKVLGRLH